MRMVYWIVSTVVLALFVHIITIFWVPNMSGNQAFAVLNRIAAQGGLVLLPAPNEAQANDVLVDTSIPYRDPYITMAACRFDLSRGPVILRGNIVSPYWSFSIHRDTGDYHYGLTQAAIRAGRFQIELRNPAQVRARILDPDAPVTDAIQVEVPFDPGIVLIKALAPVKSQRDAIRQAMEEATCRYAPNPIAQGS